MATVYVDPVCVKDSIDFFISQEYTSPEQIGLFFLFKANKFNSREYQTYDATGAQKARLTRYLYDLCALFDAKQENGGKYVSLFPFSMDRTIKKTTYYNGGTEFKQVIGRVKDTMDNTLIDDGKYLRKDELDGSKYKFAPNYVDMLYSDFLKGHRISLQKLAAWYFRFYAFDVDDEWVENLTADNFETFTRICTKKLIEDLNITADELSTMFDTTDGIIKYSQTGITGEEIRSKFAYETNATPEVSPLTAPVSYMLSDVSITREEVTNLAAPHGDNITEMKDMRYIRDALIQNANSLFEGATALFEMDVDKDALYATYLNSFPAGTNEVFRKRREFDCSRCRSFIKDIGAIVRLKNGKVYTIWGFDTGDADWNEVFNVMDVFVRSASIKGIYLTNRDVFGCHANWEYTDGMIKSKEKAIQWEHFYLCVPTVAKFEPRLYTVNDTIDTRKGEAKAKHDVFKRSLEELKPDAVQDVLNLIADNNLYRGEQHKASLKKFQKCQEAYSKLHDERSKDIYCWDTAMGYGETVSKIRNSSIGTLLVNLSEGMPIERAVKAYEQVTAPANYKRPNAIFTQRMLEDAQKTVEALGFTDSLQRRMATLDDITVNDVLFADRSAVERMTTGKSLFDDLKKDVSKAVKKPVRATKIKIEDFIKDVLPNAKTAEFYLESEHEKNLCSLVAPVNADAPTMFKWPNAISWAYAGNMADSEIKQNVAKAGGKVDGVLRCSLQWNDGNQWNRNDMDLHCGEKLERASSRSGYGLGDHIYFGHKRSVSTGGWLDIDIIDPHNGVPAVENITYDRIPPNGEYTFTVNKYSDRGGRDNFKVEIEYAGHRYQYEGKTSATNTEIATVRVKDGLFTIEHLTKPTNSEEVSHEIWGVHTGQYVPVSLICYSPNAWDGQCIGNKHYMIMLKGCKNPEEPNAWYNEYLIEELVQQHKRVFEALASKAHVEYVDDQLSGVGFSSTKDAEFFIRITDVDDKTKVYKVAVNS